MSRQSELIAIREISAAFLSAQQPADVYRFALARVSPLVGATLSCVYLIDHGSDTMRLIAAYNWPERYARFLGDMRVKLGSGPSGKAASEKQIVEVPDVFADAALGDWQEVASELGFRSIVALPLALSRGVIGTLTFYFANSGSLDEEGRGLLRVVAEQMAATAEKARMIDELRLANSSLQASHAELQKQYAAVIEARRLQDEFLSNISHELRTPLTAVMGYISLMEEGLAGPMTSDQLQTLGEVKSSSGKLLSLIGDLLELTSLKRAELPLQITTFDPREPVREALADVAGRKAEVELRFDDNGRLPLIASDRRKIARMVAAVLSNAYKFTDRGEVRLSVAVEGDRVKYRVADTGVGISAAAQRFVFDEFRQEDGSATRRYGGSGLGLAIARRLARVLGGDLTLSSEPGKGSIFLADLPTTLKR